MAKSTLSVNYSKPPATLQDHPFFGISLLDPEQREFVDSIWDKSFFLLSIPDDLNHDYQLNEEMDMLHIEI